MENIKKLIISTILCLLTALLLLPANVFAAGEIETDKDVTLTIQYRHAGEAIVGAGFNLYHVATVTTEGVYELTGDFVSYPVSLDGLNTKEWQALAETLVGYVLRDKLMPLDSGKTDDKGLLLFPTGMVSMKPGLYLVTSPQFVIGKHTYTASSFLVALPNIEEDEWNYDVTAVPKYDLEIEKDPTTPPPTPPTTSTPKPSGYITRKVLKIWDDKGNEAARPKEVIVQLLCNGEVYDTKTLNAKNNWRYTWDNLEKKYTWSIVEKEVPEYTVLVSLEGITFAVTNTYKPTGPEILPPKGPGKLPQTGVLWWPVAILAVSGLFFIILGGITHKKNANK